MSAPDASAFSDLKEINVADVIRNPENPRLIFPEDELERLAESISHEGILVPVVVYPDGDKYILIDGERRHRCAEMLGLETIPAVIAHPKTPRENLVQMFNIHLVREPWRDMPTAWALEKLIKELESESPGSTVTDPQLSDLTGLSRERISRLRHALDLPEEYQSYINEGTIPLNWFWELKQNVVEPLAKQRPSLFSDYGAEGVRTAFVDKRLANVVTGTVSLRDVRPIINFAQREAGEDPTQSSILDGTIRALLDDPELTIKDAYEDTVQIMVEADKLGRRTENMIKSFERLLGKARKPEEIDLIKSVGNELISRLQEVLDG